MSDHDNRYSSNRCIYRTISKELSVTNLTGYADLVGKYPLHCEWFYWREPNFEQIQYLENTFYNHKINYLSESFVSTA